MIKINKSKLKEIVNSFLFEQDDTKSDEKKKKDEPEKQPEENEQESKEFNNPSEAYQHMLSGETIKFTENLSKALASVGTEPKQYVGKDINKDSIPGDLANLFITFMKKQV